MINILIVLIFTVLIGLCLSLGGEWTVKTSKMLKNLMLGTSNEPHKSNDYLLLNLQDEDEVQNHQQLVQNTQNIDEDDEKGKCFHGEHERWWKNKDHYTGNWDQGKRSGNGVMYYANGNFYRGEWKDDKYHGRGKLCFLSGDIIDGNFKDGFMDGEGTYQWPEGKIYKFYKGNFERGRLNGFGKVEYKGGSIYEGYFKDNVRHGEGKHTWINGDRFDGIFVSNQRHGPGHMYYASGGIRHVGFYEDKMHGIGLYITAKQEKFQETYEMGNLLFKKKIT